LKEREEGHDREHVHEGKRRHVLLQSDKDVFTRSQGYHPSRKEREKNLLPRKFSFIRETLSSS